MSEERFLDSNDNSSRCARCDKIFPWAYFEHWLHKGTLHPCRNWCIPCRIEVNDRRNEPGFQVVHKANLSRQLKAAEEVDRQKAQVKALKAQVDALKAQIEALKAQGALDSIPMHSSPQPSTSTGSTGAKKEKPCRKLTFFVKVRFITSRYILFVLSWREKKQG